jgi:hypothetical protein
MSNALAAWRHLERGCKLTHVQHDETAWLHWSHLKETLGPRSVPRWLHARARPLVVRVGREESIGPKPPQAGMWVRAEDVLAALGVMAIPRTAHMRDRYHAIHGALQALISRSRGRAHGLLEGACGCNAYAFSDTTCPAGGCGRDLCYLAEDACVAREKEEA